MAVVVFEREPLNKEQLSSLRSYILTKRKRENERPAIESKKTKTSRHNKLAPNQEETSSTRPASGLQEGTVKDKKEQLSNLKEKLELLKKEKHNLFQELKKVLHEEEEKRKKEEQFHQHQQVMSSSDYKQVKSTSMRPSWGLLAHETPPTNKYGAIDQLRYQTQFNQQRIGPHTNPGYATGYHGPPMTGAHSFTGGNISSDFYHHKDSYSHYYPGSYRSSSYQSGPGIGSGGQYFAHSVVHDMQQAPVHMYTHHQQMIGSRVSTPNEFSSSGQYPYDPRQLRHPLSQPSLHKEPASKSIKK